MFIINKHKQLVLLEKELSKQVLEGKKNTYIGRELWEHEQAKNTSPFFFHKLFTHEIQIG